MNEAQRNKGELSGRLQLGAGTNSNNEAIGRLLTVLSERCPSVEVALKHGTSQEILAGIRDGSLDAGFYNEPSAPAPDLTAAEVSTFGIYLTAAPGMLPPSEPPDWRALAELSWIYPTVSACCGQTAENLFRAHGFRPKRIVSVDRQEVSRTLIAGGLGVGLLHADAAMDAQQKGEIQILLQADTVVRIYFAYLKRREQDPLLELAASIIRTS
jgi:DNA-binding transcriptional LysR family regulator